jgi:DNA-binding NarL/FixJ family response regulator
MRKEIKIMIADDHPIFRRGLRQVIDADSDLTIVAEADDGETTLDRLPTSGAEILLLDVDMPNKDGFEVARAIRTERLPVAVIFLTMHKDERFFNAALDLGVKGYVLKDSAVNEIIGSIRAVAAGREYVSPALTSFLLNRGRRAAALLAEQPGLGQLTPAERRILKLIAEYKTSNEIAEELFLSPRTVEHHRANICEKLELKGTHALLKFAVAHQSEL